eukprot:CAMPEP_0170509710 /NCGR_PEP_ID=MMETSP0208-20121228/65362_1 /TAXON_ID=197538 /ORGANISM="Strombidium inclinatum, Strain S3" /LENGTH=68 /DNA_ID=CAMNT_0010793093 /DNA_START=507 /DNA_END=713 /DNA_ORIENTATION=-
MTEKINQKIKELKYKVKTVDGESAMNMFQILDDHKGFDNMYGGKGSISKATSRNVGKSTNLPRGGLRH